LASDDYRYLQLDVEEIEVKNVKTVQNKPINVKINHDYDSSSLEVAHAENMPHTCTTYLAKFRIFCCKKPHIF